MVQILRLFKQVAYAEDVKLPTNLSISLGDTLMMMGFYMLHLLHVNQSFSNSAFVWPRTQMHGNSVAKHLWYQEGFEAGERKTTTQIKLAAHAQQADCHKN